MTLTPLSESAIHSESRRMALPPDYHASKVGEEYYRRAMLHERLLLEYIPRTSGGASSPSERRLPKFSVLHRAWLLSGRSAVARSMASLEGHLLIAVPKLHDQNFFHSVVLMIRHSADGAFGLTLNRTGDLQVPDVWPQFSQTVCHWRQPLRIGGPVEGPLMVLHDDAAAGETPILPGVFFSVDPARLAKLFANSGAQAQFYVGYCGWGAGQLEDELSSGAWLTTPGAEQHVFNADEELWTRITREVGGASLRKALNLKHLPPDPTFN